MTIEHVASLALEVILAEGVDGAIDRIKMWPSGYRPLGGRVRFCRRVCDPTGNASM